MIIVNIYGGIGNQMFQYAFGRSISIDKKQILKLDLTSFEHYNLRSFLLDKYKLQLNIVSKDEIGKFNLNNRYKRYIFKKFSKIFPLITRIHFENNEFAFNSHVHKSNAEYYIGYWQSFKYFENIREILLVEFSLKSPLDQQNRHILSKIQNCNSVSIHIRRGDYVSISRQSKGHALIPLSYYINAVKIIITKVKNPHFFIFSDDILWVRDNLKLQFNVDYIDFNNDYPERDINLMKNCKHNIIANSSFSWWGAWLNENKEKIVIAPKKWMNNLESSKDLIEPNWIKL
jgi:hypothetical protein